MFQTSVLSSGSKGNCFLVKNGKTQILIDAGISYKKYSQAMTDLGLEPTKLDAVIISHEHSDHIGGAGVIHRKTNAPIYITEPTWTYSTKKIGKLNTEPHFFNTGDSIRVGSLMIHSFTSPHDAMDSNNFIVHPVDDDKKQLGIATDLGFAHNLLKHNLSKATTIILESNHDVTMLKTGPYEWFLKQRILSKTGHLSNEQACSLVEEIINDKHERLILAHLSETNNDPEIAHTQMAFLLNKLKSKIKLSLSSQTEHTELFSV